MMYASNEIRTERLMLQPLTLQDADFILELVNTEDWIEFIGNRHIGSVDDALVYIKKILGNTDIAYWVMRLTESNNNPVGIVSFIKRKYLLHRDIGFALLPRYYGRGYAFEGTAAVLQRMMTEEKGDCILAVTIPGNSRSVSLLQKLGMYYEEEIVVNDEAVRVYSIAVDKQHS